MRKAALLLTIVFCSLATFAAAQQTAPAAQTTSDEQAIRAVLDAQVASWNRGDMLGYMDGYWRSPELTFYSAATINKGWQNALDHYRQSYQAPGREMGKLDFRDLNITMLGPDSALARGRFHLVMKNGREPHGVFTVVFRRFPEGWRIIHDHSSGE